MSHTHLMEGKLKPELSVKPSALWTKRPVREIFQSFSLIYFDFSLPFFFLFCRVINQQVLQ